MAAEIETETAADETLAATSAEDQGAAQAGETAQSQPAVTASPADEVHALRERLARAEGQLAALTTARPDAPRESPAAPIYTPEQIEAAFAAGQIDATRKGQEYRRYTETVAQQAAERARAEERQAQATTVTERRLSAHIRQRPGLTQAGSPERAEVLAWIEDRQGNPKDPVQQLMACDALYSARGGGIVDARAYSQRRTAAGTGGGQPAASTGAEGGKPDPLKGIPAEYVAYWRSRGSNLADPKVAQRYADRFWSTRPGKRMRSGVA